MIIIHNIDDFLFMVFPEVDRNDYDLIIKRLEEYYTYGPFKPKISIVNDLIKIEIDTKSIISQEADYKKVVSLCEKRKYSNAKSILDELIKKNPTNSEYHRIYGQILSDEGDQEDAINSLIDALRWNPRNEWALLMMGNIFAKFKDNIEVAMKYYDQILKIKPDDNIAINNIGANLMQLGRKTEAVKYFHKAIKIDPNYPHTHYALALVAETDEDYVTAFKESLIAIENNNKRDQLYGNSLKLAFESAKKLTSILDANTIISNFSSKLSVKCDKLIKIEEDLSIPTAAKIEFAENYEREYHIIKFKPNYPAVEHLIMHELVHLELADDARNKNANQLFITNKSYKNKFFYSLEKDAKRLRKKGISEKNITNYFNELFDGINRQVYNAPIDLFIEDIIYSRHEDLRPFQFLTLMAILQEGIDSTTNEKIVKNSPVSILSKSKIYNLLNALHYKELFGVDLIKDHKPTTFELNQANEFYEEFKEYRFDKKPGEEYELVKHWAEDLKLDGYFDLIQEEKHNRKTIEKVLDEIEKDPYGLDTVDPSRERKMKKFIEEHSTSEINIAVCMYMVGALGFFENMSKSQIKDIAFQIATLGISGIDPQKKGYSISDIKGKTFTGYQMLAYYYVSWSLAIPDKLSQLQLPFENEFELAKKMYTNDT